MNSHKISVILSSNIPHYLYTAQALSQEGYLKKYICSVVINSRNEWIKSFLPLYWQLKLEGRRISGLCDAHIVSNWLPEAVQKILFYGHISSIIQANRISSVMFDRIAQYGIDYCDVFHFVSSVGLSSAKKAKKQGSFIICDERSGHPDYLERLINHEYKIMSLKQPYQDDQDKNRLKQEYELADLIILPSHFAAKTFIEAGFSQSKLRIIPYGVDLPRFNIPNYQENIACNRNKFVILYAGQMIPRKGVHYLVDAFNKLDIPNSELWLLGRVDSSLYNFLETAKNTNHNIKIFGSVPKIELNKYYSQASVFVLPSIADSFPLVSLEAMAAGIPVIVTENTGSKEVVRDTIDGFVIPIRDSETLMEKIQLLFEYPDLRQKMGHSAKKQVMEFTWERYGKLIQKLYRAIEQRISNSS